MAAHSALIAEAKRLQRLQTQARKLRADLRRVEDEMRLVRKHLRALAGPGAPDPSDPDDQLPPDLKGKVQ